MQKRMLGRTDIEITPVGLGCWQVSPAGGLMSGMVWDAMDQHAIAAVIAAAMKAGVNWFDTAEAYGRGASEKSLAAGLAALGVAPGSVRIANEVVAAVPRGRVHRGDDRSAHRRPLALPH